MTQLQDHEARAIIRNDLDCNLVVESAAGTGKTTVLVHRIVAVLAQGRATVDRIVAVTFTEKAAGELKLHIRVRLEEARQQTAVGNSARTHLEAALSRLEEARVGTIHGFCADLLRERSLEAGIDPRFEPLDENAAQRLFRRAFDAWFEACLQEPPAGLRRALRRVVRAPGGVADGVTRQRAALADGPIGRLRGACWALAERRDLATPWHRPPFERSAWIGSLVEQLHAFADASARCDKPDKDALSLDTRELRQWSADIRAAEEVSRRDHDGLEALFVDMAGRRDAPRKGYGKGYGDGVTRDAVLQAHTQLRAALQEFTRHANADLAALLHQEFRQPLAQYEETKEKTGRLDFTDLLLRARDLVRDQPTVRAEFQRRFSHIFVDEFQDTDPLQAEILMLLAAQDPATSNWRQVVPAPGKLFLVGDPKQSIYRFRGADIGIYFEVRDLLIREGARCLQLTSSFRSLPNIQAAVNTAFASCMNGDRESQQAAFVAQSPVRPEWTAQPSVIALPVPRPFGKQRLAKTAIDASLPDAVAAFVHWLLHASSWTITDPEQPGNRVPIAARHVCILMRRFDSFAGDVTRGYVRALEARDIRHLLLGGRSYHEREEVETLRAALNAIEWPDDELSVFATLHGSLFAIGDEELLVYRRQHGRLHPMRIPPALAGPEAETTLRPIGEALAVLAGLHRERNTRPVAETLHLLLEGTRAHAGFVLRPSGEQVLANVLHLAEQARGYERDGGISFRGFVERVEEDAEGRRAGEAPILEAGSDGVRLMTVHRAKGLEFPVVILADITANLASREPSSWIDRERNLCVQKLCGWSPAELLAHAQDERRRDAAEGIRIAYVAATRARDLLVVPAIGTEAWGMTMTAVAAPSIGSATPHAASPPAATASFDGWVAPLNAAIYPPRARWASPHTAPGCPPFGESTILDTPFDRAMDACVYPGEHAHDRHRVVWWDPTRLTLDVPASFGLRHETLLDKDVDPAVVRSDLEAVRAWGAARAATLARAATPRLRVQTATERAHAAAPDAGASIPDQDVELVLLPVADDRPRGARFGALVHAVLGGIALDATADEVQRFVDMQARIVGATAEEILAASAVVTRALQQPLLAQARGATQCRRETPVTLPDADGTLVEGVVDLAFLQAETWMVVDFKTDPDIESQLPIYTRQVALYAAAIGGATQLATRAILMRI